MKPEAPIAHARDERKQSLDGGSWFMTFTFLDLSSAISSSQLRRLLASIANLWRRVAGNRGSSR
jgi:hypothetical protein